MWVFGFHLFIAGIRLFDELSLVRSMLFRLFSSKGSHILDRGFHVGKQFTNPSTEDIIFKAICVNLRQRRWKFLDQMTTSLTNMIVDRVVWEFRNSPQLALKFFNWVGKNQGFSHSLKSYCIVIHFMVNSRKYDDALFHMKYLMQQKGYLPLEVLGGLVGSSETCLSSPAAGLALKLVPATVLMR